MSELYYKDTKPQGAPDFYFAINATFRFILRKFGQDGFIRWLREMGADYFEPINKQWRAGGLSAVADYWRAFFAAEPEADVIVNETATEVEVVVRSCPAISHLRLGKRDIVSCYCQHCYYLSQARARAAGMSMVVEGGNGSCVHTYALGDVLVQDLGSIKEAS